MNKLIIMSELSSIDWPALLANTSHLIIWCRSNACWIEKYQTEVKNLIKRGGIISLFVPNYNNLELMDDFVKYNPLHNNKYCDMTRPENDIKKTIKIMKGCFDYNGTIFIYLYNGMINFPAYVLDKEYVIGYYACDGSNLSPFMSYPRDNFINNQIKFFRDNSEPIFVRVSKGFDYKYYADQF